MGIKKSKTAANGDNLFQLAFYNGAQASIISIVSTGKIVIANSAACKFLGYSQKDLLTKKRSDIFDINEDGFKKMLKEHNTGGQSIAMVIAITRTGKPVHCEISSSVFLDEDGNEKSIISISDMSGRIQEQQGIDAEKEKTVADNILQAKSAQKELDVKNEKVVADNIIIALEKQKIIDSKNEKTVADNIILAKSVQKKVDIKNEKVVADNIAIALEKQKAIDIKKKKTVADNIMLAKSAQKKVDIQNEKVVADNINIALEKQKAIDIKKEKTVADNIVIAKSEEKKAAVKKEKTVAENIVAAQTKQEEIDIGKEKIVAENITIAKATADARVAENNLWIEHIAKTSYDVMWDWDIVSGKVYIGDSVKEVFGYELKNHNVDVSYLKKALLGENDSTVEENLRKALASNRNRWADSYSLKRQDGTVASVNSRASIVRDKKRKAIRMIGATQDVSRLKELEEKLEQGMATAGKLLSEYNENFSLMFNSSSDVLYDVDLIKDKVLLSNAYQKEFGYLITPNMKPADVWPGHVHPDDKATMLENCRQMLVSGDTEGKYSYRFLKADNSVANILSTPFILRDATGKAYRIIGSMQDISKQTVLEEKLETEIKLKEKQIADAMKDAKETERSDIGKELHDNINQLLGVSRLYLEMAKRGGPDSEMHLSRSSEYTLSAIEEIRKLTKGLTTDTIKHLGLGESIYNLTRDTMQVNPVKISCVVDSFIDDRVNEKFKLNLFRIVQEQLNNILKHAGAKEVSINLSQNKKSVVLVIADDGIGFDMTKKRKGIGVDNIRSRAIAYNGKADFVTQPGNGCVLTVSFSITDEVLKVA